jgi:hypothetical protein
MNQESHDNLVPDPRTPGGERWRVGEWMKHLRYHNRINFRSIEQGGFPSVYAHWSSANINQQRDFLQTLDPHDYVDYFNMFYFSYEDDAIMFKLKGI